MTLDEIKADIVSACREFKAAGYPLVDRGFDNYDKAEEACGGCALTAVGMMKCGIKQDKETGINLGLLESHLFARYGWSGFMVDTFTDGFDGYSIPREGDVAIFQLGRAVRAEVLP